MNAPDIIQRVRWKNSINGPEIVRTRTLRAFQESRKEEPRRNARNCFLGKERPALKIREKRRERDTNPVQEGSIWKKPDWVDTIFPSTEWGILRKTRKTDTNWAKRSSYGFISKRIIRG